MNAEVELERLRAANRALEEAKAQLEARAAQLERKAVQLEANTLRLEADAVRLQAEHSQVVALKEGLETQLQEALLELAELKRQIFGEKSEKLTPEEESQLAEVAADLQEQAQGEPPASDGVLEEDPAETPDDPDPSRKKRRRGRHPLPEHLERRSVILEPAGLKACEHCGQQPIRIGQEVSEELEYVPARLVVSQIVRPKYACSCGCGGVAIAPLPPRLLPQSKLGVGLAVHLLLSRFDDHVAYHTLERIFLERHGVVVPRQQIVQWVAHIAFLLQPIYRRMFEQMKKEAYLQVDETPVKVLDPEVKGKCARGYLWFYASPGGDVFLDFQDTRARKAPHTQLNGFLGTIQTDAYEVYDSLKKVLPGLVRIGCAAHSRRKFYVALKSGDRRAMWFIGQFRQLYRIESQVRDLTPDHRQEIRNREAPQIWAAMKQRAEALQKEPGILPQSTLGKALRYLINEHGALIGYLQSGRYRIDNNLVENSIRSPAVGRRRWLFIGHPDAGWRSAVIYSLILSCRRRAINPQDYLTDVLQRLPSMAITEIDELLPARWKPVNQSAVKSGNR